MVKLERKFWQYISNHWPMVILLASTVFSLLIRYYMRGFLTEDMERSLIPWFNEIKQRGGIASLAEPVGNYNIPYQTIIALLTYIPFKPIYLYKLFSCLFDWLQAILIYYMVLHARGSKLYASVAYGAALFLPVVVFNSTMWGQCDSVYTFFCLLALYFLWQKRTVRSFISLGTAFAFKLQAVFVLPFFLFIYARNKFDDRKDDFSLLQFLWIPAIMVVLSLGGILQGMPVLQVFDIYHYQTITFTQMSKYYPGFWCFLIQTDHFDYYLNLFRYGILLTVFVLMLNMIRLLRNRKRMTIEDFYKVAFLMTYTSVFFLPAMHERYSYCYILLVLFLCFLDRKMIPIFLALLAIDLTTYSCYLFTLNPPLSWKTVSFFNCIVYLVTLFYIHFCRIGKGKEQPNISICTEQHDE